jgi:transketolase
MGTAVVEAKEVKVEKIKPIEIPNKLASTPTQAPKYSVTIKNKSGKDVIVADPKATRAFVALMDVYAVEGGAACHWGGPAALAETMSSIHAIMFSEKNREWYEAYNFVNDAGHTENGIYALRANYAFDGLTYKDLTKFRSIESKLTGHGESHLNPEGVYLSNGPLGSALPQAQGLAVADKVTGNDRVTICVVSDGAAMEGEAKEAFAAIPGLASKGKCNPFVMIISDNNTKLSGRIDKDSFTMEPTFESFKALGWNVIEVKEGNNLEKAYHAIESAIAEARANDEKPVCVIMKTVKGYGVKATEADATGGHGFPLKNSEKIKDFVQEIVGKEFSEDFSKWADELHAAWSAKEEAKKSKPASPSPAVKKEKIQVGIANAMMRAAEKGYPVYSISSDLAGSTGTAAFQKSVPDRVLDIGIAESNMVSTAAGFSKQGYIPVVDTFAQFGITKGNLPLTMAALSQAPVIAVFSHTGFQDAADGASHQATTYIAATSPIPHTTVIALSTSDEADQYMYQAIERHAKAKAKGEQPDNVIFFLGRENFLQRNAEGLSYEWGKAQVLSEGTDVVIVSAGSLTEHAVKAGEKLKEKGISATIINTPFVNHPDVKTISTALKKSSGRLITMDDHQVVGGMGAQLIHALVLEGVELKAKSLAIHGEFGRSAYTADQLYKLHHLDADSVVKAAEELLKK